MGFNDDFSVGQAKWKDFCAYCSGIVPKAVIQHYFGSAPSSLMKSSVYNM